MTIKSENEEALVKKTQPTKPETGGSVGVHDIASALGISIGTVSRSLNNRSGVHPKTRSRVLAEARRQGYVPNAAARELRSRPARIVGLFFSPFVASNFEINPAALRRVQELQKEAARSSLEIKVIFFSGDDDLRLHAKVQHLDVAILYGQFECSTLGVLNELDLPVVLINEESSHHNQASVLIDTQASGFDATQYMAALGHTRVGVVNGPLSDRHSRGIRVGVEEAVSEFRLSMEPDWMVTLPGERMNKDGAAQAMKGILSQELRPTAMIFASDWLALGCMAAAREMGLNIPTDMSIIGYDDLPIAQEIDPPLTTCSVEHSRVSEAVIRMARRLVEARVSGQPMEQRTTLLTPSLIKRRSCACVRPIP